MALHIASQFAFTCDKPTSVVLQFEAAQSAEQTLLEVNTHIAGAVNFTRIAAQDAIGERVSFEAQGQINVTYEALVQTDRAPLPLEQLAALPVHDLPSEAVPYLLDSRYCHADDYQGLAAAEFEGTCGGGRIAAIKDWMAHQFTYAPGTSTSSTTATDSFIARMGVCRDYTHVLVMLARASMIPARYVACYAPGVTPQDFHAVAEVFLADPASGQGAWHMVDATGMADLANAAQIGVGRDAADVSFCTTFGPMRFEYSKVDVALRA